jgi:PAS domain S-box-containing protein
MKKGKNTKIGAPTLRRRAEERLVTEKPEKGPRHEEDQKRLLHELQVHQIELEMQNEALREAQAGIEASQSKYSDFYDFAPVGFLTLDKKGLILELNLTATHLLGDGRAFLKGKPFSLFVPSDHQDALYLHKNKVLASAEKQACDLVLKKKDGTLFHGHLESMAVETDGHLVIRSVLTDITERKHSEDLLRRVSARDRSLIEASLDPLVTIDPKGRITDVNTATEHVCGYSRETMIGTDFSDYFTDPGKAQAGYVRAFKQGFVRDYELEMRHKNGHLTPVLYNASVYRDEAGNVIGVFAAARDISKRKRVEAALKESEERYRIAIESASDGIAMVKGDGHLYVNKRFAEIFGYDDPGEIIGKPLSLTVHPEDLEKVSEINRMRQEGEPVSTRYEFKGIKKDGTHAFIEVSAARTSLQGEPVSLAYLRDITEQRNSEDQLRQAHKMEALGTLAGGIAHDFNNILAAIMGFTEMVIEDLPEGSQEGKHLGHVLLSAHRGKDLIKQILAFSRKAEHVRGPMSLTPIVNETVKLLRASISKTVEIAFKTTTSSDEILASPVEIQQILMNLATNAALAMQATGGVLEISLADIDFEPDSPALGPDILPGEYVQLAVKDTGTGIPPDVMKRVFEPFFTTREVGKGTGMGLAVVYGIVKDLQGTITVESEPGFGTTFRVCLPKVELDTTSEPAKPDEGSPGGNERVLFVDDEDLLVELGQARLERLGYTVTALTDATKALKLFSRDPFQFDLVITDQAMPKLTGLHLARKLLKIRSDIPIILCTGHSDTVSPEKAKEAGIKEFIMKPLGNRELAQVIRGVLDTKSQG